MHEFDDAVLQCFLDNQGQLFPEDVAANLEEAEAFLEECLAVVVDSIEEAWKFLKRKVSTWRMLRGMKSLRPTKYSISGTEDIS